MGGRGNNYELAFRIVNLPDSEFGWKMESKGIVTTVVSAATKDGRDVPDTRSITVKFNDDASKKDLQLGLATCLDQGCQIRYFIAFGEPGKKFI